MCSGYMPVPPHHPHMNSSSNSQGNSSSNRNSVPPLPPRGFDYNMRMYPTSYGAPLFYGNPSTMYGSNYGARYDPLGGMPPENSFVRLAEESSRPAFQSIESIVHAVASISMMLESTYAAVHTSFRAVLGVADHFSRLRSHLAQLLSTLAVLRTMRWLLRKALYILGLVKSNPSLEQAWEQANGQAQALARKHKSTWPILIFFSAVLGFPWLIWRMLTRANAGINPDAWAQGEDVHILATAQYDFKTDNIRELPLTAGQHLRIAPKEIQPNKMKGWLLASVDGTKIGFVPSNYVKIQGVRKGTQPQQPQAADPEGKQPLPAPAAAPASVVESSTSSSTTSSH
ncbi:PEX13 [Cordylochernes scorpioides]|uniref:Peroxisomal membrane protein PEX13 n=1 Tax=Cordylochernes scorpioides TaxID=51811 RepID=A0ABY6L004_9ARAC|nr:PEX13 [Cordylochernes scorpioides]